MHFKSLHYLYFSFGVGCSWLPLPPCLASFVSLHDLHSGLLLAAAAALSCFICLPSWSPFWAALGCRCRLFLLHLSPFMTSINSGLLLAAAEACLPSCVSLHDLHSGLLLAAALPSKCSWLPLPPCLPSLSPPSWSPFWAALGWWCRLVPQACLPTWSCLPSLPLCVIAYG